MSRYDDDEPELRAELIDRTVRELEANRITREMIDAWLVQEFGKHLADLGGLRGFAERLIYGSEFDDDMAVFERFEQWPAVRAFTDSRKCRRTQQLKAHQQGFADRLAACLRHHGLTMQDAAQRFEECTGRSLNTLDLRRVPYLEEDLASCGPLGDLFDVDAVWLILGEEAGDPPAWYNDET